MRILHLVGQEEDNGGILSVIRGLHEAAEPNTRHTCLVRHRYQERRTPRLDYRFNQHLLNEHPSHLTLAWNALRSIPGLLSLLNQERFDVIHAHSRGAFLAGWILAASTSRTILFTNHTYARRIRMYQRAARHPRFHTVVLTPNMARHYGLLPGQPRLHTISACFADSFLGAPLASPTPTPPFILAGVGNLVRWKNWHLAIAAIRQLPDHLRTHLEFRLYGPTPNDPDSQQYAAELRQSIEAAHLQPQVRLLGPSNQIQSELRQAHGFLIPSTNEPCSVALMEALALGIPVIASASGGNIDLINANRTGLLFQPDNAADLARQLQRWLTGEVRLESPENLRASISPRCASRIAAAYSNLYRELCDAP